MAAEPLDCLADLRRLRQFRRLPTMSVTTAAVRSANRLQVTNVRPIPGGGQLVAAFDLEMPSGLTLVGCKLFRSASGPWIKPPDCVRIDRDGHAMLKPSGGRIYDDVVRFTPAAARDRWREGVLAALETDAPELMALAMSDPPPPPSAARSSPRQQSTHRSTERIHSADLDDEMPF